MQLTPHCFANFSHGYGDLDAEGKLDYITIFIFTLPSSYYGWIH